jgi:DNA-binding NarL/FixJ family response regulator
VKSVKFPVTFSVVPNAFLGLEYAEHTHFNLIIIQQGLHHLNATDVLHILRTVGSNVPIVVILENDCNINYLTALERQIFFGFLKKACCGQDLCELIRKVAVDEASIRTFKDSSFITSSSEESMATVVSEAFFCNDEVDTNKEDVKFHSLTNQNQIDEKLYSSLENIKNYSLNTRKSSQLGDRSFHHDLNTIADQLVNKSMQFFSTSNESKQLSNNNNNNNYHVNPLLIEESFQSKSFPRNRKTARVEKAVEKTVVSRVKKLSTRVKKDSASVKIVRQNKKIKAQDTGSSSCVSSLENNDSLDDEDVLAAFDCSESQTSINNILDDNNVDNNNNNYFNLINDDSNNSSVSNNFNNNNFNNNNNNDFFNLSPNQLSSSEQSRNELEILHNLFQNDTNLYYDDE